MSLLVDLSNDAAALADRVSPRIVAVRTANGSQSSGFVWRTGLVVTADEALDGEDEVELLFADGKTAKATIIGRDPSTDVTLIKADTAEFGDWDAAEARPAAFALRRSSSMTTVTCTTTSTSWRCCWRCGQPSRPS